MAARSALQRTLEDTSRPEEEIFADALAVAREKKLATDYIARISDDLFRDAEHRPGTALPEKPVSVEHAVRALVKLAIAQKESLGPLGEDSHDHHRSQTVMMMKMRRYNHVQTSHTQKIQLATHAPRKRAATAQPQPTQSSAAHPRNECAHARVLVRQT